MNDSLFGVLFIPKDKKSEFKKITPDTYHADAIRKYILENNINIDNIENKLGYLLSLELLSFGIMTFQYEGSFVNCFIPYELSKKQYDDYQDIKEELRKKVVYITNHKEKYSIKSESLYNFNNNEGYFRMEDIINSKQIIDKEKVRRL